MRKERDLLSYFKDKGVSLREFNEDSLKGLSLQEYLPIIKTIYYYNQIDVNLWKDAINKGHIDKDVFIHLAESLERLAWEPDFRDSLYKGNPKARQIFEAKNKFISMCIDILNIERNYNSTLEIICQSENEKREVNNLIDETIIKGFQQTGSEKIRDGIYDYPSQRINIRLKYKDEVINIPCHLEPKYYPLLKKMAHKYRLENIQGEDKEVELQEARIGLFKGAMEWQKDKGAIASWLKNNILWAMDRAFKEASTEAYERERREKEICDYETDKHFQKRILKGKIESSGGFLDDDLTLKDNLKSEELSRLQELIRDEELKKIQENPKIMAIIDKKGKKPLTPAERKALQRFKDNLKKD